MDTEEKARAYNKSGFYVRAPAGFKLRDKKVERLARKMRLALPWLRTSDHPTARAWAEIEYLCSQAYAILRANGLVNGQGEPRRLLSDSRQLRQAQLAFARELAMTPLSRMQLKLGGAADVDAAYAEISEQHAQQVIDAHERRDIAEDVSDETVSPTNGSAAPSDDHDET